VQFATEFYSKVYDREFSGRSENNPRPGLVRDVTILGVLGAMEAKVESVLRQGGGAGWERMFRRYVLGGGVPSYSPSLNSDEKEGYALSRALSSYLLRHNVPFSTFLITLKALFLTSRSISLSLLPSSSSSAPSAASTSDMGTERATTTTTHLQVGTGVGGGRWPEEEERERVAMERKRRALEEGMRHVVHMTGMQMQMGVAPSLAVPDGGGASTTAGGGGGVGGGGGGGGALVGGWSRRSLEEVMRVWDLVPPPPPNQAEGSSTSAATGGGGGGEPDVEMILIGEGVGSTDDEFGHVRRASEILSRGLQHRDAKSWLS